MMKLSFSVDLDDLLVFYKWYIPQQKGYGGKVMLTRLIAAFVVMMPFVITALYFKNSVPEQVFAACLFGGVFGGVGIFLSLPKKLREADENRLRNFYAGDKGKGTLFGKHTVEIRGNQLVEKTELSESVESIALLEKIVDVPAHVFVLFTDVKVWVIPKNKIEYGDLDSFVNECKRLMTGSKGSE